MKSAIKDIFYGFKGHMETMKLPKEHFENSIAKLCEAQKALKEKLTPELSELHQKFRRVRPQLLRGDRFLFCGGL